MVTPSAHPSARASLDSDNERHPSSPPDTPDRSKSKAFNSRPSPLALKGPSASSSRLHSARGGPIAVPSNHLITVLPPPSLPHDPPHPRTNTYCSGYGPPQNFRRGVLIPLYPTLAGQVGAIAREYGLPSTGGLVVYLLEMTSSTVTNNGLAEAFVGGPRIGEEAWALLWSRLFEDELDDLAIDSGLPSDDFDAPPVPKLPRSHLGDRSLDESSSDEMTSSHDGSNAPLARPTAPWSSNTSMTSSSHQGGRKQSPRLPLSAPRSSSSSSRRHPHILSSFSTNSQPNLRGSSVRYASSTRPPSSFSLANSTRSAGSGVIVGKIEFDIDRRRGGSRWYEAWIEGASGAPSPASDVAGPRRRIDEALSSPTVPTERRGSNVRQELFLPSVVSSRQQRPPMVTASPATETGSALTEAAQAGYAPLEGNDAGNESDYGETGPSSPNEGDDITAHPAPHRSSAIADPLADVFGRDEQHWSRGEMAAVDEEENSAVLPAGPTGLGIEGTSGPVSHPDATGEALPPNEVQEVVEMLRHRHTQGPSLSSPIHLSSPDAASSQPVFMSDIEETAVTAPLDISSAHSSPATSLPLPSLPPSNSDRSIAPSIAEPGHAPSGSASSTGPAWSQTIASTFGNFALRRGYSNGSTIKSEHLEPAPLESSSRRSSIEMANNLDDLERALAELSPKASKLSPRSPSAFQAGRKGSLTPSAGGRFDSLPRTATREGGVSPTSIVAEPPRSMEKPLEPPAPAFRAESMGRGVSPNRSAGLEPAQSSPARSSSLAATQAYPSPDPTSPPPPLPKSPTIERIQTDLAPAGPASPESAAVESPMTAASSAPSDYLGFVRNFPSARPDSAATTKTSLAYLGPASPPNGTLPFSNLEEAPALPSHRPDLEVMTATTSERGPLTLSTMSARSAGTGASGEEDGNVAQSPTDLAVPKLQPAPKSPNAFGSLRLTKPWVTKPTGSHAKTPSIGSANSGSTGAEEASLPAPTPSKQPFSLKFWGKKESSEARSPAASPSLSSASPTLETQPTFPPSQPSSAASDTSSIPSPNKPVKRSFLPIRGQSVKDKDKTKSPPASPQIDQTNAFQAIAPPRPSPSTAALEQPAQYLNRSGPTRMETTPEMQSSAQLGPAAAPATPGTPNTPSLRMNGGLLNAGRTPLSAARMAKKGTTDRDLSALLSQMDDFDFDREDLTVAVAPSTPGITLSPSAETADARRSSTPPPGSLSSSLSAPSPQPASRYRRPSDESPPTSPRSPDGLGLGISDAPPSPAPLGRRSPHKGGHVDGYASDAIVSDYGSDDEDLR